MSRENVIAVIFDCDGTLCKDTTTFLLRRYGQDTAVFWKDVDSMAKAGWDPSLAYVTKICDMVRNGVLLDLNNKRLREIGAEISFFPGLPEAFRELKQFVHQDSRFRKARILLELYIITGGLEELIKGSKIYTPEKYVDDIFGCTFEEDSNGKFVRPKSVLTFTEKTKFLFAINKGIVGEVLRTDPYEVNKVVPQEERRVPFNRMIYVGDGPSDVPCFSIIKNARQPGVVVGVWESRREKYPFQIVKGQRHTIGPFTADYRTQIGPEGGPSDLRKNLEAQITTIGLEIVVEMEKRVIPAPEW